MGKIWLVICNNEDLLRVRGEILARDARARFLRFDDPAALLHMARAFSGEALGMALCERALGRDALDGTVHQMARTGLAEDIAVFTCASDPEFIARCFRSGATEVIAAGDSAPNHELGSITTSCMGEELHSDWAAGSPADDDEDRFSGLEYREDLPPWVAEPEPVGGVARNTADRAEADSAAVVESKSASMDVPSSSDVGTGKDEPVENSTPGSVPDLAGGSDATESPRRAPLIAVISGRGGCGKTTLVAAMAACAARAGLRSAVLDLDLMFGNLYTVLGATGFKGFEGVGSHATDGVIAEADIEGSAMRIGPGLTLWGPCEEPERAELVADSAEQLIETLRGLSDVIFVDTSVQWGDAVAMAVGSCDRCLVVGSAGTSVVGSTKRAMGLATRLGVPTTRMTGVFNRVGARGCGEDQAMHFEIGISLRSHVRIPDGGDEVAGMLSFGQVDRLMAGSGSFARAVRAFTYEMLQELGCPVGGWLLDEEQRRAAEGDRARIRLPWKQRAAAR